MSPQSRIRRSLPLALRTGVTLTLASVAFAGGRVVPFVLKVYASAPGGRDLLSGRYPTALRQLREHGAGALERRQPESAPGGRLLEPRRNALVFQ